MMIDPLLRRFYHSQTGMLVRRSFGGIAAPMNTNDSLSHSYRAALRTRIGSASPHREPEFAPSEWRTIRQRAVPEIKPGHATISDMKASN